MYQQNHLQTGHNSCHSNSMVKNALELAVLLFSFCDSFMMLNNHFIQFRIPAIVCFAAMFEFTYSFFQPFFFNTVSIHRSYTLFPTESCHTHETDQDGRENLIHPFNMSEWVWYTLPKAHEISLAKEKAQALRLSFSLRCQIFINFELKFPLLRIDYIYIFT